MLARKVLEEARVALTMTQPERRGRPTGRASEPVS